MTETEWLACDDPLALLNAVGQVSQRKGKLLVVGCCRQHKTPLQNRLNRKAILAVEQNADGVITDEELYSRRGKGKLGYRIATACSVLVPVPIFIGLATYYMTDDPEQERLVPLQIVRDIFCNPFRSVIIDQAWLTSDVVSLAEGIYQDRAFDRMPILADALQDAGCDNTDILNHCRQQGEHVRGCWVIDLLTGRK